jgi:tetratricopeptide (TPR) repeat protein
VTLWKDSRTLFAHALAVTRDNAIAHQGLGNVLLEAGEIQPAITQFEAAARLVPDLPDLQGNLGAALGAVGRYDEAAEHFRAALRTRETAGLHLNLGSALVGQGRLDEAIREYEAAVRLDPGGHRSLMQLAVVYAAARRFPDAARCAAPELPGREALAPGVARRWAGGRDSTETPAGSELCRSSALSRPAVRSLECPGALETLTPSARGC